MNVGLTPTPLLRPDRKGDGNSSSIAGEVVSNLQRSQKLKVRERRRNARYAFPHSIHLTPLDDDGQPNAEASIMVMGRHISERGLDFYHEVPLRERKVIASFRQAGVWLSFLLELQWCRFHHSGWCENGGRFLQPVEPPIECFPSQYEFNSLLATS